MANTTSILGRLKVVHPDLGYDGGAALEAHVKGTLTKISDAVNSRYFVSLNLANLGSVDFEHNFKCAFSELRILLYTIDGSDELTRVTSGGTPDLDDFTIAAKIGNLTTHITVTNNTGSEQDIALVVVQGKGAEVLNDLGDVNTTGKEDGQALVYSLSAGKFIPGASGDASFKFQSINGTGTQLVVKKGYIRLSDGRVLYLANDLTIDVSTTITTNGYWYAYLDVNTLAASSIVSGRKLVAITSSNFVYSETAPEDNNLTRYISMGQITRSGGSFTLVTTEAFRTYDFPLGADKSLEYTLPLQAIGAVGTAGQIAAGHVLAQGSFPSAAYAATSFYNLTNTSTVNDGNTVLGHNLTNTPSTPFTGTGILGIANSCALFNGTTHYLSSTDPHFNPGDTDFTFGGWFNPTTWSTLYQFVSKWGDAGTRSYQLYTFNGYLWLTMTIDGTNSISTSIYCASFVGWHHVCAKYIASTNTAYLYIDGKMVSSMTLSGGLFSGGAFEIGRQAGGGGVQHYSGLIDEFFFCNGTAFTDNDIAKIYASKLTHSRTLSPVSQKWLFTGISAGGQARELFDNIVDMDTDDLYFDLSDELSTTQVELKLYNRSQTGLSKAAKARTLEMTATALDALLPLTHGLGSVPELSFKVKNGDGDYEYHDHGSVFKTTATQIKLAGDTLATLYGGTTVVVLTYATATQAQYIPNRFWNAYKASASRAVAANDKVYADPSGGSFNLTLPATASLGDGCIVFDYKGNFSVATKVTLLRNGHNINGVADDFDLDTPGRVWNIEYVDLSYGFSVR